MEGWGRKRGDVFISRKWKGTAFLMPASAPMAEKLPGRSATPVGAGTPGCFLVFL